MTTSKAIDPYKLNEKQFKAELADRATPTALLANAPRIYDFLAELFGTDCGDSLLREWAFQWWSDRTGKEYDLIYNTWLKGSNQ